MDYYVEHPQPEHMQPIRDWLTANGVDPHRVHATYALIVKDGQLECVVWRPGPDGKAHLCECPCPERRRYGSHVALDVITVPLVEPLPRDLYPIAKRLGSTEPLVAVG